MPVRPERIKILCLVTMFLATAGRCLAGADAVGPRPTGDGEPYREAAAADCLRVAPLRIPFDEFGEFGCGASLPLAVSALLWGEPAADRSRADSAGSVSEGTPGAAAAGTGRPAPGPRSEVGSPAR